MIVETTGGLAPHSRRHIGYLTWAAPKAEAPSTVLGRWHDAHQHQVLRFIHTSPHSRFGLGCRDVCTTRAILKRVTRAQADMLEGGNGGINGGARRGMER